MGLKACRECGAKVSTSAKTCPHCGVKRPAKGGSSSISRNDLLVVLFLVATLGVAAVFHEPDNTVVIDTEPAGPLDLAAEVRRTSTQITVTNTSSSAWTDCSIHVNPGVFNDGYVQQVPRIGPGEVVAGGLMAFVDGDGARFNPGTHVVQNVDVRCQTPAGEGWYSGEF